MRNSAANFAKIPDICIKISKNIVKQSVCPPDDSHYVALSWNAFLSPLSYQHPRHHPVREAAALVGALRNGNGYRVMTRLQMT